MSKNQKPVFTRKDSYQKKAVQHKPLFSADAAAKARTTPPKRLNYSAGNQIQHSSKKTAPERMDFSTSKNHTTHKQTIPQKQAPVQRKAHLQEQKKTSPQKPINTAKLIPYQRALDTEIAFTYQTEKAQNINVHTEPKEEKSIAKHMKVRTVSDAPKKKKQIKKKKQVILTAQEIRKRKKIKKYIAIFCVSVALIVAMALLFYHLLQIKKVNVETQEAELPYSIEEIQKAFGQPWGNHMFGFSKQKAAEQIQRQLPYLEVVQIKRNLPDEIKINVARVQEAMQIQTQTGQWAVLSKDKRILRISETKEPAGLLTIIGAQILDPVPGEHIQLTNPEKIREIDLILQSAHAHGLDDLQEIDVVNSLELNVLYQGRLRIILGTENDMDYKMQWAFQLVGGAESVIDQGAVGRLDVSTRNEEGRGKGVFRAGSIEVQHELEQTVPEQPVSEQVIPEQPASEQLPAPQQEQSVQPETQPQSP